MRRFLLCGVAGPSLRGLRKTFPRMTSSSAAPARMPEIELVAKRLQRSGPHPLWDGYRQVYARDGAVPLADARPVRTSNEVRSEVEHGMLLHVAGGTTPA